LPSASSSSMFFTTGIVGSTISAAMPASSSAWVVYCKCSWVAESQRQAITAMFLGRRVHSAVQSSMFISVPCCFVT
jgi:hypothetical protein